MPDWYFGSKLIKSWVLNWYSFSRVINQINPSLSCAISITGDNVNPPSGEIRLKGRFGISAAKPNALKMNTNPRKAGKNRLRIIIAFLMGFQIYIKTGSSLLKAISDYNLIWHRKQHKYYVISRDL
jgi:hypothetical protein